MPQPPVISNNTPLSALWSLGQLSLLRDLFGTILIPPAVEREFLAIETEARRYALQRSPWIIVAPIKNSALKATFATLDDGEAEVLALALEQPPRLVIVDERLARRSAKRLNLPLTGTIGVLLRAKRKGLLSAIRPLIDELILNGFYLHESVINRAIQLAGENE